MKNSQDRIKASFLDWWENEGSAMGPLENEDTEEFARRVTEIAWLNGAFCVENAGGF